jgi:hypothetical protein
MARRFVDQRPKFDTKFTDEHMATCPAMIAGEQYSDLFLDTTAHPSTVMVARSKFRAAVAALPEDQRFLTLRFWYDMAADNIYDSQVEEDTAAAARSRQLRDRINVEMRHLGYNAGGSRMGED